MLEDIGLLGKSAPQRIVVDAGTGDGQIKRHLADAVEEVVWIRNSE